MKPVAVAIETHVVVVIAATIQMNAAKSGHKGLIFFEKTHKDVKNLFYCYSLGWSCDSSSNYNTCYWSCYRCYWTRYSSQVVEIYALSAVTCTFAATLQLWEIKSKGYL